MRTTQIAALVVSACALLGTCRSTMARTNFETFQQNTVEMNDCAMTIEVWHRSSVATRGAEQELLTAGEPVWVKVTLKNLGKSPIGVEDLQPGGDFEVLVTAPDGSRAPLTRAGKSLVEARKESEGSRRAKFLEQGESLTKYIQVSCFFDMTVGGRYTIWAARRVFGHDLIKSKPLRVELQRAKSTLTPGYDPEVTEQEQ